MNVRWSNRAATEFAATAAYVASEFGQRAAQKMRNSIDKAVENISHFPRIGVASFTDEETGIEFRELHCRLNSVVYTIYNDEVCYLDPTNPDKPWPVNYEHDYLGPITIRQALVKSRNTIAAQLWTNIGGDTALWYLKQVGIEPKLWNKFPNQLSGGEAQRVGIVRAIINSPDMVFADEPTGALNSSSSDQVLNVLTDVNRKGQSILMVTHDMKSARRGNRIIYLKDGTISGECDLGAYVSGDRERHDKLRNFLTEMGW